jgi:hypothetical protein
MTGVVILTGLGRRKDTFNTARMTGYPKEFVQGVRRNLRKSGIWGGELDKKTYTPAVPDEHNFLIIFTLMVMCGSGMLVGGLHHERVA